jgi:glutamate-1-semialdehyde 2,1-aminomutase
MARGTHYGASHELELTWARKVQELLPSAERVRFTSSGTEAVQLAVRIARAFTGRELIVKFGGSFHGWSDGVSARPNGTGAPSGLGIPEGTLGTQVILPQNDVAALARTLDEHEGRIAAAIIEPTGASMGNIPIVPEFVHELRRLTERAGVLLIFDEVVTGFRISPGGAQEAYAIRPDLTTLAKILAGGLPGGAVAGREVLLSLLDFADPDGTPRRQRIAHAGTFNANPLAAAAGVAALEIAGTGEPQAKADAAALRLSRGMNGVLARHEVAGCVYGHSSILNIVLGKDVARPQDGINWDWTSDARSSMPFTDMELHFAFRRAMINEGVDLMGMRPIVSAAHDDEDIDRTIEAFDHAITQLREEGLL